MGQEASVGSERCAKQPSLSLLCVAYTSLVFDRLCPESGDFIRTELPLLFSAMLLAAVNMITNNVSLEPFKSHSRPPTSRG